MTVFTARTGVVALISMTMLLAGLHTTAAMAQESLLSYQPIRASMMPLDTEPSTVAEYEVSFNTWALARSERHPAELVLPDGSRFKAVPEEIKFRGDWATDFAWRGWLEGEGGHGRAVITVHRGHISARITLPGRDVMTLKPGPETGTARLLEHDSSKFPSCTIDTHESSTPASGPLPASFPPVAPASAGSAPIIDVLVAYTQMAEDVAGGEAEIEDIIQNAVDVTNDAYANSLVYQRIHPVYVRKVPYTGDQQGAASWQELDWLRNDANVAALRNQYQADLVALITGSPADESCGSGQVLYPSYQDPQNYAHSVTRLFCAVVNLTFSHELGHNMALNHDPDPPDWGYSPPPQSNTYPWSYGHILSLTQFSQRRTIMAYPNRCGGCAQVEHFSNPNVLYTESESSPGVATGIANERDNARTLNLTANIVANHRRGNWLYADRFEDRGYALSGTTAPPPMTQAEACGELETQLKLFEARLAEKGAALDRTDEDAIREFEEESKAVEEIRKHLASECQ